MEKTLKGATAFLFDCLATFCIAIILVSTFFSLLFPIFPFFPFLPYPVHQKDAEALLSLLSTQLLRLRCSNCAVSGFWSSPTSKASAAACPQGRSTGALSFLCLALTLKLIPALNLFCFPIHKLNYYPEMLWRLMNAWKAHCRWKKYSAASSSLYV